MRIDFFSCLLGAALLATAANLTPSQELDDFEEEFDDSAWTEFLAPSKEQVKRNLEMDKRLQGAWQLIEFEAQDLEGYGRNERGIAVFGPGFFSIEMHIAYDSVNGFPGDVHFQSGSFRYRFDDEGQLLAKLSIGAAFDRTLRAMHFERPGLVRTFGIEVTESTLELKREPGGFRYLFTRLRSAERDAADIFGRPVVEPTGSDPDFDPPNFEDPVEVDDPEDGDKEQDGRAEQAVLPERALKLRSARG